MKAEEAHSYRDILLRGWGTVEEEQHRASCCLGESPQGIEVGDPCRAEEGAGAWELCMELS
jgi:hypothetical protein